ncbi:unnamed protein product, partial [Hapterophycus canaliculatus]
MMFFMPLLQCAAIVAFLVPWSIYCVYTASLADVSETCPILNSSSIFFIHPSCPDRCSSCVHLAGLTVRSFEYSDEVEKRGWYLLFIFFWTTQFVVAMGQIVVALSVVKYYFTRDVETVSSTQKMYSGQQT